MGVAAFALSSTVAILFLIDRPASINGYRLSNDERGNLAEWFAAVGTVGALVASAFQLREARKAVQSQFLVTTLQSRAMELQQGSIAEARNEEHRQALLQFEADLWRIWASLEVLRTISGLDSYAHSRRNEPGIGLKSHIGHAKSHLLGAAHGALHLRDEMTAGKLQIRAAQLLEETSGISISAELAPEVADQITNQINSLSVWISRIALGKEPVYMGSGIPDYDPTSGID